MHGITRDEARGGWRKRKRSRVFSTTCGDGVIVGHHIGHDIGTLDAAYERGWGFRT